MKKSIRIFILAVVTVCMGAVLLASCNGSIDKQEGTNVADSDSISNELWMTEFLPNANGELVKSNDLENFTYNVFCILKHEIKGNFVCSPYGIAALYRMLADGADGQTLKDIEDIISVSQDDISNITKDLAVSQDKQTAEGAIVENSNLIAVDLQKHLLDEYNKAIKSRYLCDIQHMDLTQMSSINRINAYIKERTHGLISDVLGEQSLGSDLIALNTIFFKGYWANPFDESATSPKPFKNLDGSIKTVDMMNTSGHIFEYPYFDTEKFQAVALNYIPRERNKGKMNHYALYVFLPHPDANLADVMSYLKKNDIKTIQHRFEKNKDGDDAMIQISLPKFTSQTKFDVMDVLETLGLKQQTLFTHITDSALAISRSMQHAVIELNERYTEAAAVTHTDAVTGPAYPDDTFIFCANRPFIYILVNEETGTIFFIGQYADGQIHKDGKWQSIDSKGTITTPPSFVEHPDSPEPPCMYTGITYPAVMPPADKNTVYEIAEQMPEFPGGIEKCLDFIIENLRYPKEAKQNNIQGRVICEFIVEIDGTLSEIKVIRPLSPECDKEAMRLIQSMPKWQPGLMRGMAVRTRYVIPIRFHLDEEC